MCFLLLSIIFLSLIPFRCTGRRTSTPRQQVNKLTSYIDGSVVYGETEERNKALREFKDGKMKLGLGDLLPVSLLINHNEKPKNIGFVLSTSYFFKQENTEAISNDNPVGRDANRLVAAGDSRANEQPGLIALHTLFVREHNRLSDEYKDQNPQVQM